MRVSQGAKRGKRPERLLPLALSLLLGLALLALVVPLTGALASPFTDALVSPGGDRPAAQSPETDPSSEGSEATDTTAPPTTDPPTTAPPEPSSTTTTLPTGPSAQEQQRLEEEARLRQEEVQRRLARLQALSQELSAKQLEVFRVSAELDVMDEQLASRVEDYNLAALDLEEARQKSRRMQRELDLTEEELQVMSEFLEARIVAAYKSDLSALEVLLSTTDMADFIKRLTLLVSVARSDQRRIDEVMSLRARAHRLLDSLSKQIYEVTVASVRLEEERRSIEAKMSERQAYVDRLSAEIRGLVDEQREIGTNMVPSGFDLGAFLAGDGSAIVKTALKYLGVPYVWGGATPAGFDCSGLVQYVFMQHGIYVPHYSRYQAMMGVEVPLAAIAPGDLVFFGSPVHHVGIYMGDDLFVNAPRTGDVVKISKLSPRGDLSHIRRLTFAPAPAR